MCLISADEKGLYDEVYLGELEENGFLGPLDEVGGIEHIGWFNRAEPVFRLVDGFSIDVVGEEIKSHVQSGVFNSAGLRGFVIPTELDVEGVCDIFSDALLMLKVENWWDLCIPHRVRMEERVWEYIFEREDEMRGDLLSQFSGDVFLDRHIYISVDDGSYGQYQYVAWK